MLDISLKYFRIINYFILATIVFSSLLLTRSVISSSFSKKKSVQSINDNKIKPVLPEKKDIMNYTTIMDKNPFGPPLKLHPITVTQEKIIQQAPISDLVLIGTAVGLKNPGYAIFIDKSDSSRGEQEIFAFGEDVFNYGKLVKISASDVELEKNSSINSIAMKDKETGNKKIVSRKNKKNTSRKSSKKSFAKKIGDRKYVLDSRKVQQSLANPERLLTDARLLPVIKNGKQEGFIISEVVPDGMYHSLGLINGDTLLKINGLEISNPEVAIQAMTALKGMNSIDLDIIRNGAKMSLSYQIK